MQVACTIVQNREICHELDELNEFNRVFCVQFVQFVAHYDAHGDASALRASA